MASINTADLEPGMVLAKDLRSPQGRLLLSSGEPMEVRHITLCKRWGIAGAEIANVSSEDIANKAQMVFSSDAREKSKLLAQQRFCSLGTDEPACREVLRQFLLRAARDIEMGRLKPSLEPLPVREIRKASELPPLPSPAEIVARNSTLATLPQSYGQIVEALNDPNSSAAYVAETISHDSSLSARLLRLVNSPFYGFSQRIDSLDRAVALVGSSQLSTLALGVSVFSLFQGVPRTVYSLQEYCRHSVACGIVARTLAGYRPRVNRERMFALGLLHDIGRLLFCLQHPEHCLAAIETSRQEGTPLHEVERTLFGWDHSSISRELLTLWRLPESLSRGVGEHHPPLSAEASEESLLLHVSDVLAHALALNEAASVRVPPIDAESWGQLELGANVIAAVMQTAEPLIDDTFLALFKDAA